ncbi:MAG: TonB family protein, partial [Bacteroidota bacterium]
MKVKKNDKPRTDRNSGLYFALGLSLVLVLTYVALEWKTYYNTPPLCSVVALDTFDDEFQDIPPLIKLPDPPKPKHLPPKIEILPDIAEKPESVIDILEMNYTTEVTPISMITFAEPLIEEEVDFITVEEKPVFPGCENATDRLACFQVMMLKHIQKNFNYPQAAIQLGVRGKVYIKFSIQKDGGIGDIQMRGPHKLLEEEALKIIKKLPEMTPGKQRGT